MFASNAPAYHPSREDPNTPRYGEDDHYHSASRNRLLSHPDVKDINPDKIAMLPALVEDYYSDELKNFGWESVLKMVLCGTRDDQSPLKLLREHENTIVQEIYSYLTNQGLRHVKITIPASLVGQVGDDTLLRFSHGRQGDAGFRRDRINDVNVTSNGFDDGFVAFSTCGWVDFPPPADRNVNMLPFVFGSKVSLPDDLQCYHSLIECCPYMRDEIGKVGYLTVHESYVDACKAQRREGIHIESPGIFQDKQDETSFQPALEHHWGMGMMLGPDRFEGGIFMASSVSNTCEVWDALVDKSIPGLVDHHGGCEYLRPLLGKGTKLEAGELIWMTDSTPHEAIPLPQEKSDNRRFSFFSCCQKGSPQEPSGYHRQFFRVVSPHISHWYADHSTSNPKVELPKSVRIVKGSKFAK